MEQRDKVSIRQRSKNDSNTCTQIRDQNEVRKYLQDTIQSLLNYMLLHPEKSSVTFQTGDRTTVFEIDIAQLDFGRLMGAKGRNLNSLRTLVAAVAGSHNFRAIVQIKDENRFF